jgi:hypothetical protein
MTTPSQGQRGASGRPGRTLIVPPPDGFDALAYISRSLARTPWSCEVTVLLHLSIEEATQRLPATLAELVEADDGTLLQMRVSSLDWIARILAGLDCGFTIYERTSFA